MRPLLKLILRLFNFIGLNPLNRGLVPNILCFLTFKTSIILCMASILSLVFEWNGIDSLDNIDMLPLVLIYPVMLINLLRKQNIFHKMLVKIETFWPQDKFGQEVKVITNKIHTLSYRLSIIFLLGFCIFGGFCVFTPLIYNKHKLVYHGKYFCNLETSPCFQIVHSWQITILILQGIPAVWGFESLFIYLVAEAYCAIEMIKFGLKNITVGIGRDERIIGKIAHQHAIILSFIDDMRDFYNATLLLQFWSTLVSMVFSLYMITTGGFPPSRDVMTKYGLYLYALCFQLLIYCIGGTLILEQSLSVSEEAYSVDWWAETSIRKDLMLIIERSQKSSKLLIGSMSILNLEGFVTVCRNAFSVYGLLKTMDKQ